MRRYLWGLPLLAALLVAPDARASGLLDKVTESVSDAAEAVGDGISDAAEAVGEGVSNAAEAVGEGVSDAADTVDDATDAPTGTEIDRDADRALQRLYAETPEAKDLAGKSVAILVFPTITKAGLIVGGEYGEGTMRQGGQSTGYYNIAGASYGLQIGGQQFSYAMFFLNHAALQYFRENNGWEAGSGPTLVGGEKGWSASLGTNDLQGDIVPVFWGQEGLMAGVGLQGIKITKVDR